MREADFDPGLRAREAIESPVRTMLGSRDDLFDTLFHQVTNSNSSVDNLHERWGDLSEIAQTKIALTSEEFTMSDRPSPEETAGWQKRLAAQANNRAWALAESTSRSPEEDEEMLQAAHAAMYFWKIVGNASNRAHAAQLLAHAYGLLKLPNPARHYLKQSQPFFLEQESAPWERAFAHAVAANVAAAAGEFEPHARHYREAERLVAALADPEDRAILGATMRVIARPVAA